LAASVCTSTQVPEQRLKVGRHSHFDDWHSSPALHATPQAPQFRLSLVVSTQLAPQIFSVPVHGGFFGVQATRKKTQSANGVRHRQWFMAAFPLSETARGPTQPRQGWGRHRSLARLAAPPIAQPRRVWIHDERSVNTGAP
jgi:hypothetical protein